jgi:hypothetical protein
VTAVDVASERRGSARQSASGVAQRILLTAGVLSSILYIGIDLISASRYPGYSILNQAPSELSAIGAPRASARLWFFMGPIYGALIVAFAAGVLRGARNRAQRVTGSLMLLFVAVATLWPLFPMHERGTEFTGTDTGHIVMAAVIVSIYVSFMGFGAFALGGRFRTCSLAASLGVALAAGATFLYISRVVAGLPTPWLGLVERVSVYGYLVWVAAFAIALMRRDEREQRRLST